MTNEKYASGAFVFTRARGLQPQDPDNLLPLACRHSIDASFIPTYAGDRVAISRAITQASSGLQREGLLLRPIKRTNAEVLYGIVKEQNDGERLDHDFEATVSWVTTMLDLRQQTIVHRDGTVESQAASSPDPTKPPTFRPTSLRFGGATFLAAQDQEDGTMLFVSRSSACSPSSSVSSRGSRWSCSRRISSSSTTSGPTGGRSPPPLPPPTTSCARPTVCVAPSTPTVESPCPSPHLSRRPTTTSHSDRRLLAGEPRLIKRLRLPDLLPPAVPQRTRSNLPQTSCARSVRRRYKVRESTKQYTATTVNSWWRVLRAMLREAVRDCDLPRDPTMGVKALPEEPKPLATMTTEELARFLEQTKTLYPQHFAMVMVLSTTGLRFGEASALRWEDLDEQNELIHVRRRQVRGKLAPPKSKKHRSVAVPAMVFQILREHRQELLRQQAPGFESGIVFPSLKGGYRQPSVLNKPFVEIAKAAKVAKHVTAHTLRRTYNNLMRQVGVDRMILRSMTGHSSEAMTEHYSEVTAEEKRQAVQMGLSPILGLVAGLENGGSNGGSAPEKENTRRALSANQAFSKDFPGAGDGT